MKHCLIILIINLFLLANIQSYSHKFLGEMALEARKERDTIRSIIFTFKKESTMEGNIIGETLKFDNGVRLLMPNENDPSIYIRFNKKKLGEKENQFNNMINVLLEKENFKFLKEGNSIPDVNDKNNQYYYVNIPLLLIDHQIQLADYEEKEAKKHYDFELFHQPNEEGIIFKFGIQFPSSKDAFKYFTSLFKAYRIKDNLHEKFSLFLSHAANLESFLNELIATHITKYSEEEKNLLNLQLYDYENAKKFIYFINNKRILFDSIKDKKIVEFMARMISEATNTVNKQKDYMSTKIGITILTNFKYKDPKKNKNISGLEIANENKMLKLSNDLFSLFRGYLENIIKEEKQKNDGAEIDSKIFAAIIEAIGTMKSININKEKIKEGLNLDQYNFSNDKKNILNVILETNLE